MKLIGSKQEDDFRKELIASNIYLSKGYTEKVLLKTLKNAFDEVKTAYILSWIPEQCEDIYIILIGVDKIAKIEISKIDCSESSIIEMYSLKEFEKGLSKIFRIKLAVAIDLATRDLM